MAFGPGSLRARCCQSRAHCARGVLASWCWPTALVLASWPAGQLPLGCMSVGLPGYLLSGEGAQYVHTAPCCELPRCCEPPRCCMHRQASCTQRHGRGAPSKHAQESRIQTRYPGAAWSKPPVVVLLQRSVSQKQAAALPHAPAGHVHPPRYGSSKQCHAVWGFEAMPPEPHSDQADAAFVSPNRLARRSIIESGRPCLPRRNKHHTPASCA
jgi:hypothetical protein